MVMATKMLNVGLQMKCNYKIVRSFEGREGKKGGSRQGEERRARAGGKGEGRTQVRKKLTRQ